LTDACPLHESRTDTTIYTVIRTDPHQRDRPHPHRPRSRRRHRPTTRRTTPQTRTTPHHRLGLNTPNSRATHHQKLAGQALDNAVSEAFNSTLEFELLRRCRFATREQARRAVAAWIDEYNSDRRHSTNGMLSPVDYEQACATQRATEQGIDEHHGGRAA
jgi:transposase InsO family protein